LSARRHLIVASDPAAVDACPDDLVVSADQFLEKDANSGDASTVVLNLCDTVRYGSKGYYVSLLADARGQQVLPSLDTIAGVAEPYARFRALQEAGIATVDAAEMTVRHRLAGIARQAPADELARPLISDSMAKPAVYRAAERDEYNEVDVVLGQCVDTQFESIAAAVFRVWPVPLLRLQLLREGGDWKVSGLTPISPAMVEPRTRSRLGAILGSPPDTRLLRGETAEVRAAIAVLVDAGHAFSPSSTETIERLERVAARRNVHVARIGVHELRRVTEYDALFVRCHTSVTQPAFQFALRAEALGMPVIDHPQSTMRCTNKVFMQELLERAGLPTPRTRIITAATSWSQIEHLGLPFVLKLPDGDFSAAVHKITSRGEYQRVAPPMFIQSPLLIAQEWLPTDFDWRIGVLGGKLLFAARYYMARGHWQIRSIENGTERYGRVEAVRRTDAPPAIVKLALEAAALVGNGFYGIDIKETPNGPVVIEINDNPNLDTGYEDMADGDAIYEDLIEYFVQQIEASRGDAQVPLTASSQPEPSSPEDKPRNYRLFDVAGIELEYPIVDGNLNVVSLVEPAFRLLSGRGTSDVDLGRISFSNEFADHVFEIKTNEPVASMSEAEQLLYDGIQRFHAVLKDEFDARLLPTGMHPWLNPLDARLWTRSGLRVYTTYARLFNVRTHGWMNVQAMHLNLPFGSEAETIAMHNAAVLLIPYLPALAASTPIFDGELQDTTDSRLMWLTRHQQRIPESMGRVVPEYVQSFADYRKRILKPMYNALDGMIDAGSIRHEFFNSRAAVLRFTRRALEIRALDTQECVNMDAAIAAFTRAALAGLTEAVLKGELELPDHDTLVEDFHECIRGGSRARVTAPYLRAEGDPPMRASQVLRRLLLIARQHVPENDAHYLDLIERVIASGSLSERIRHRLQPFAAGGPDTLVQQARLVYAELADSLIANVPWPGRFEAAPAAPVAEAVAGRDQVA